MWPAFLTRKVGSSVFTSAQGLLMNTIQMATSDTYWKHSIVHTFKKNCAAVLFKLLQLFLLNSLVLGRTKKILFPKKRQLLY